MRRLTSSTLLAALLRGLAYLVLDPSRQPLLIDDRASIAQDIAHMIRDSGLLHHLWGTADLEALWQHPKSGASWEGFALEQVLHVAQPDEAYFWATHAGAELDLLMFKHGLRVGVEFKRMDAPRMTPSMHTALNDLKLDALYVVYSGERRYSLNTAGPAVQAIPLQDLSHLHADWN